MEKGKFRPAEGLRQMMGSLLADRQRVFWVGMLALLTALLLLAAFLLFRPVWVYNGASDALVYTTADDPARVLAGAGVVAGENDRVDLVELADGGRSIIWLKDGKNSMAQLAGSDSVELSYYGTMARLAGEEETPQTKTVTVNTPIPYGVTLQKTTKMDSGETRVVSPGVEGVTVEEYEQTVCNGQIVRMVKLDERVEREPVDEVLQVGTYQFKYPQAIINASLPNRKAVKTTDDVKYYSLIKPPTPIELDENGYPIHYKRLLTGPATAYIAPPGSGTATGRPAMQGHIAVDPKEIPYGSAVFVVSANGVFQYGYSIAADTGGFIKSNTLVDLFFSNMSDIYRFGRQDVLVFVL